MSTHRQQPGDEFEGFRRDRKRRLFEAAPQRDLGKNPSVLRELEAAEQAEAQNERISREVHDFFSAATRTAAEIVARVNEDREESHVEHVQHEMVEFLNDAIERATHLATQLQATHGIDELAATELRTDLHNIIGRQLDEFRAEGTAQLGDKHIGQDPFASELEERPPSPQLTKEEPVEIQEHLAAEIVEEEEEEVEQRKAESAIRSWFLELCEDQQRLAETLKCLVTKRLMPKAQAIEIFRELSED